MNRIQNAASPRELAPATNPSCLFEGVSSGTIEKGAGIASFVPLHYEPNYAYPLVVWLHGPGDDEGQLKRIMPHISMRNYLAIAVRGTKPATGENGSTKGFGWQEGGMIDRAAEQRVLESIDYAAQRWNVARDRVFLAGFDAGGMLGFRLAMSHPERFAGVLSLGGGFPRGGNPLARLNEARRVPLFLACGRDSERYRSEMVCDDLRLFHSAGMVVALRIYPCGHEITTHMLSDMDRWIMEQITQTRESATAPSARK